MQNEMSTLEKLSELLTQDGQAMVMALVILIIGLASCCFPRCCRDGREACRRMTEPPPARACGGPKTCA